MSRHSSDARDPRATYVGRVPDLSPHVFFRGQNASPDAESETAPGCCEQTWIEPDAVAVEAGDKWLRAVLDAVGGADLEVEVGGAGAAGVAGGEDEGSGFDVAAAGDVEVAAVAVGPSGAEVVDDGDADAAGGAAVDAAGGAALLPPVVRPGRTVATVPARTA